MVEKPKKRPAPKKKAAAKKSSAAKRKTAPKKTAPKKQAAGIKKTAAKKKAPAKQATKPRQAAPKASRAKTRPKATASFSKRSSRVLRWMKRLSLGVLVFSLLFLLLSTGWVAFYSAVNPPLTPLMIQRSWAGKGEEKQIRKIWRGFEEISPWFSLAVLCAEDQRFPDHRGIDWVELRTAIEDHQAGKPLRGASTISQQVAKNLFLWNSRSFIRKGMEAWFTFLLESLHGKKRILELYLNIAELGAGIYGAEAAAQYYYEKPASELNAEEAALLAVILPNPRERDPRRPTPYLYQRQHWVLQQMRNLGGPAYLDRLADQ